MFESTTEVVVLHVGSVTLRRLGRPKEMPKLVNELLGRRFGRFADYCKPKLGDLIVISAGEIDCRCHVGRFIGEGRNEDLVLGELADAARALSSDLVEVFGVTVAFLALPPPSQQHFDPLYPTVGVFRDRLRWVSKLNVLLSDLDQTVGFLDLPSAVVLEDGSLNPALARDTVHLSRSLGTQLVDTAVRLQNEGRSDG